MSTRKLPADKLCYSRVIEFYIRIQHTAHARDHEKLHAIRWETTWDKFYHESGRDSCKSVWLSFTDSILQVNNNNNAQKQLEFKYGRMSQLNTGKYPPATEHSQQIADLQSILSRRACDCELWAWAERKTEQERTKSVAPATAPWRYSPLLFSRIPLFSAPPFSSPATGLRCCCTPLVIDNTLAILRA